MRLLLIEDEEALAEAVGAALRQHGCVVDQVATLADGQEAALCEAHDAILLDRRLPDGDGASLIPALRRAGVEAPIVLLTARGELEDRIQGLDLGADDYLVKPFATEELLARLRAIRRRPPALEGEPVRVGRLVFDLQHGHASVAEVMVPLTRRERLVLQALVRRAGRTVVRSALEAAAFGFDDDFSSNTLDAHVSRLRRKLLDANAGVEIHPIRGVGYLLQATP